MNCTNVFEEPIPVTTLIAVPSVNDTDFANVSVVLAPVTKLISAPSVREIVCNADAVVLGVGVATFIAVPSVILSPVENVKTPLEYVADNITVFLVTGVIVVELRATIALIDEVTDMPVFGVKDEVANEVIALAEDVILTPVLGVKVVDASEVIA